jgi:hypothetical protein
MSRIVVVLLAAMTVLGGCAHRAEDAVAPFEPRESAVFGHLRLIENGKDVTWGSLFPSTDTLTLFVRPAGGGAMQYIDVPADGHFFAFLQRGEYTVLGFELARSGAARSTRVARLMTRFTVSQPGQAFYVGALRMEARGGASRIQVLDEYDAALTRAQERITAAKLAPAKTLMALESPVGRYARITSICAASWAIECDANYQGVRPLQPEGTERRYVQVQGRTPLLQWKPSAKPGTTYDVAIYESLQFKHGVFGEVHGLRGSLVAYAEALTEPRYVPPPLEPGKLYQWSVRLRDGDTVSSWSTTSHSSNVVIAASRSSGRYFTFATP